MYFTLLDDPTSPWYLNAQEGLLNLLMLSVDTTIDTPAEGSDQYNIRKQIQEINQLLVKKDTPFFNDALITAKQAGMKTVLRFTEKSNGKCDRATQTDPQNAHNASASSSSASHHVSM